MPLLFANFFANALSVFDAFNASPSALMLLESFSSVPTANTVAAAFKSPGWSDSSEKLASSSARFLNVTSPPFSADLLIVSSPVASVSNPNAKADAKAMGGQNVTFLGSQNAFFIFDLP